MGGKAIKKCLLLFLLKKKKEKKKCVANRQPYFIARTSPTNKSKYIKFLEAIHINYNTTTLVCNIYLL